MTMRFGQMGTAVLCLPDNDQGAANVMNCADDQTLLSLRRRPKK
jgi:hypothetical protein